MAADSQRRGPNAVRKCHSPIEPQLPSPPLRDWHPSAKPWRHDAARFGDTMSHFTLGHALTLSGFGSGRSSHSDCRKRSHRDRERLPILPSHARSPCGYGRG